MSVSLEAPGFIFGYTCVNDVTAAEVLNENGDFAQWCRSKGYDTFGCLGPAIATDFDWANARVITRLDGTERQNYPLSDMILPPAELVSRISQDMSLLPGDVIAVGTSLGVGSMKDGATVEIHIEGIGSLTNTVQARCRLGHQVLRLPGAPQLDVVDQLVGEELHGAIRGPGDMRSQNEIGTPHVQQRMPVAGRLDRQDVESGARDEPLVERLNQRRFIDQPATRGIDEKRVALHLAERIDVDQVARRGHQRAVQRDHIGFGQHLLRAA